MRLLLLLLIASAVLGLGAWLGLRGTAVEPAATSAALELEPQAAPQDRRVAVEVPDAVPPASQGMHSLPPSAAPARGDVAAASPGEAAAAQTPLERRLADLNRMAIRALEAGDFERACALFEQCVKGAPEEPVFGRNLAEALVRRALQQRETEQPCARCIADLERAIGLAPEREDLAGLLERWRAEASIEAGFWSESSQHFELAYDGERSELLHGSHRVIEELERAYTDLALQFGTLPVENGRGRIRVVLYRREGFGALTGLGDWAGGAFDGSVRIPVEDLGREERALAGILRHELVHAFVLEVGGQKVPGWLNEGLAQWLEPEHERDLERARAALAGPGLFPLAELEGSLATWKDPARIERAYAQSLAFVDHLARHYGERVPFALVAGCRLEKPPSKTFPELTRVPLQAALDDLAVELAR